LIIFIIIRKQREPKKTSLKTLGKPVKTKKGKRR